jgi:hypothetical protein
MTLRKSDLDAAIVAGYQRWPDEPAEVWVFSATWALVAEEPWDSSGLRSGDAVPGGPQRPGHKPSS